MSDVQAVSSILPVQDGLVDELGPVKFFALVLEFADETLKRDGWEIVDDFIRINLSERRDGFSPYVRYVRVEVRARRMA